jgi:hypothetical protein
MPFCTECGARHSEDAVVCPKCGSEIARGPDDDFEDLLSSMQTAGQTATLTAAPSAIDQGEKYLGEIQRVRGEISAQSSALQHLADLSWSNPEANAIRDQLTAALDRLHTLTPPPELAPAHSDFVEGAELLANGFASLVDATERGDAQADRGTAESSIAEATGRFLRGAQAINNYLVDHGFDVDPDAAVPAGANEPVPGAELPDVTLEELEGLSMGLSDEEPSAEPEPDDDELELTLDEVASARGGLADSDELDLADELDDIPPLPPELEDLPEPPPTRSAGLPSFGAPVMALPPFEEPPYQPPYERPQPPAPPPRAPRPAYQPAAYQPTYPPVEPRPLPEQWSATEDEPWPALGDPAIDSLLLEVEGGWVRGRPHVHDAIERAVRAAVADALRSALETRLRIEQEARAALSRVSGERARLLDEVESLRREAHGLQAELAELRRGINELERERQVSLDRRQQMFQDAETHRNQLLKEIEQLGGQLESMRRNIVNLLNLGAAADLAEDPPIAQLPAPEPELAESSGVTEVRISGVASPLKNMQLQRAIRAVDGVEVLGQPQFKNGVLTVSVEHDPAFSLRDALEALPGAGLSFRASPDADTLEFVAA